MALRIKSVEYATSSFVIVATGVARAYPQLMVYIPETGSRTFKSCFVTAYAEDCVGAATNTTAWRLQASVSGAALDTTGEGATNTYTISQTGENYGFFICRDVTSLFNTNFPSTATSASFDLTQTITGVPTSNCSYKLHVTYEYEDSAAPTRIKTVRIPLQSTTGSLSTAMVQHGQPNQIPLLDTFLPEASKVYRSIYFDIFGNQSSGGNTTTYLSMSLDNNPVRMSTAIVTGSQASARYFEYIFVTNSMATNTTHSFWLGTLSTTGCSWDTISTVLSVTYEYDHENSTRIMNSIQLALADDSGLMGGHTSQLKSRFIREIIIEEPGPITSSQCGVTFYYTDSATITLRPTVGTGQTEFSFVVPTRVVCGGFATTIRFSSGAIQGEGFNINRGYNSINVDWYRTGVAAGSLGSNLSAFAYINYISNKSQLNGGDANHNHTCYYHFLSSNTGSMTYRNTTVPFAVSMSNYESTRYWLTGYGFYIYQLQSVATNNSVLLAQVTSSDARQYGWEPLGAMTYVSDAEVGVTPTIFRARDSFKKYPWQFDNNRLDVLTPRLFRYTTSTGIFTSGYAFYTYHTLNSQITGTIAGYTGDGSGIRVEIFESSSGELYITGSTIAGGIFYADWYGNSQNLYAVARQDSTHLGRSEYFTASYIG